MKILSNGVKLTDGNTAFTIDASATVADEVTFYNWALASKIFDYVYIETFYQAEIFGDISYPAIILKKGAPKSAKTLILLKWK